MTTPIKIGIHQSNLSLVALSKLGTLERRLAEYDAHVEWVTLPLGPRTVDYIGAGLVDFGGTGATPPITGQANGIDLVYVATSQPRPLGGILVRSYSKIETVKDLAGMRIAFAAGSWLQQLLAFSLESAGLVWTDIVPLDLSEAVAHRALHDGHVDAWATGAVAVDGENTLRYVAATGDIISNRSTFFASRVYAEQHPQILRAVLDTLNEADHWIAGHSAEAAHLFLQEIGEHPVARWEEVIGKRPWGLVAINDTFVEEQQRTVDLFHKFGLITRKVSVRDAVLKDAAFVGNDVSLGNR